jgi:hypothetical protein
MISRSTTTLLNSNQAENRHPRISHCLSLVDNQLAYPTITIIDRNYSILFQQQSYLKRKTLFLSLKNKLIAYFDKNFSN